MDINEIESHIHELKSGDTNWRSVEKLAALCTVRDELAGAHEREKLESQKNFMEGKASFSLEKARASAGGSEFLNAAMSAPWEHVLKVLDSHMRAIKLIYPKEFDKVVYQIKEL